MFSYVCLRWGGYRDGLILYGVESYLFGCIYVISIRKMLCSVKEWVLGLGSLYSVYCVYDLLSMIEYGSVY